MKLAITGGTGFVGSRLIDSALTAGHSVHALARRDQPARPGVRWIAGSLADRAALEALVADSDAVIHVAGVLKGTPAMLDDGNVAGTLTMLAAATAAGTQRFVHVSSLAAREPRLSQYGRSKAEAEALVRESGLDWSIVRPPAVYGPGDRETLDLFRMARLGLMIMPPKGGRFSLIHVDDLALLLLALAAPGAPTRMLVEPDDGRAGGWAHAEFGRALGAGVGRRPLVLSAPAGLLNAGARIDTRLRRSKARLTPDRAAYFAHPDWVADPRLAPPADLWRPRIETVTGLADTARWYRSKGWL